MKANRILSSNHSGKNRESPEENRKNPGLPDEARSRRAPSPIGHAVRYYMRLLNRKTGEVAREGGIHPQRISELVNGQVLSPSSEVISGIVLGLGISMHELYEKSKEFDESSTPEFLNSVISDGKTTKTELRYVRLLEAMERIKKLSAQHDANSSALAQLCASKDKHIDEGTAKQVFVDFVKSSGDIVSIYQESRYYFTKENRNTIDIILRNVDENFSDVNNHSGFAVAMQETQVAIEQIVRLILLELDSLQ